MRFFYRTTDGRILQQVSATQIPDNPTPDLGAWIPFTQAAVPAYNPATQALLYSYTVTATEVLETIAVRPLTSGEVAVRSKQTAKEAAKTEAKADTFVRTFIAMTPADVTAYVEANVTTLAEAKNLMKKLALMLLFVAKESFED